MFVVCAEIWPGGDARYAYSVGEIMAANQSNFSPISAPNACENFVVVELAARQSAVT